MLEQTQHLFEFGPFRADPAERSLCRQGELVPLTPKVFELLVLLLENAGRVVEKERLLVSLWPDVVVEEANLTRNVSRLRKALGEETAGAQYIETVPKLGYRFVAEVQIKAKAAARPLNNLDGLAMRPAAELVVERVTLAQIVTEEEAVSPGASLRPVKRANALLAGIGMAQGWRALAQTGVMLSLLLAGLAGWWNWLRPAASHAPMLRTIAVLPLANLSPEQSNGEADALGTGFADVLTTRLSGLRAITVRPLRAVLNYDRRGQDEAAIGRALQADVLLSGSVQRVGERLRLTLRLVNVAGGAEPQTLWTGQFDEKYSALLLVQDTVADKVTEALALNLTEAEKQLLARRFTQDADAQHLYEKGFFLLQRQRYLDKAAAYLRLALERDPNFALAYCRLGEVQTHQTVPAAPGTWELLKKSLALEPELAEGWAALGFYQMFQAWDWAAAEKSLRRALELKPGYAKAHQWYAEWLAIQRRLPEATAEMQLALAIDPTSPNLLCDLAKFYVYARDYERALDYCRQALALDPEFFAAHSQLSGIYWLKGQEREAFEFYLQWRKLGTRSAFHTEYLSETYEREIFARQGFKGVLAAKRSDGLERAKAEPSMAGWTAQECASVGEREQALYWMERATRDHKGGFAMPYLGVDPVYDGLRADPQFQAALRQVGLAVQ